MATALDERLERIEAKLDALLSQRPAANARDDVAIDLCLASDDPIAALRERNRRIKRRTK